jgi:hypothetical protein
VKRKGKRKNGETGKDEGGSKKTPGLGTSVPSGPPPENPTTTARRHLPPSPIPPPLSSHPLSILFLGDATRPEFQESRACLNAWGAVADFADPDAATTALAENRVSPDVVVIAQSFPGQVSHQVVDRLRRLAPLARVLGLMGSWCEGEMRSGSPWPAAPRTYWHQWPTRCSRQLRRLATGRSCSWALPPTATEEERLLADAELGEAQLGGTAGLSSSVRGNAEQAGGIEITAGQASSATLRRTVFSDSGADIPVCQGDLVVIHSPSREMAEWLSTACRERGLAAVWQRDPTFARVERASAGIFDSTGLNDDQCSALRRFAAALRPAPIVALLSFPRIEDHQRAVSAGASTVLSKPVTLEDLLAALPSAATCHSN